MGFFGLPVVNGDFGGETSSPVTPSLNGTAPTPSDPGSGGTFLNELGAFSGVALTGIASIIKATNTPSPITIPRTTNLPSSSLQRLTGTNSSNLLLWVIIGLALAIGIKFLRK